MMEQPKIINLPKIADKRGNLSLVEENNHIPFKIARTYWIYDVPGGEVRGGHAYHENEEFIIALSGSFDVVLTNCQGETQKFSLNRSYFGLSTEGLVAPDGEFFHKFSRFCLCFNSL